MARALHELLPPLTAQQFDEVECTYRAKESRICRQPNSHPYGPPTTSAPQRACWGPSARTEIGYLEN